MIVASFLPWRPNPEFIVDGAERVELSRNGWELGMLGLWQTIIGGLITLVGLIGMLGKAKVLPRSIVGFATWQLVVLFATPPLLWNFGLQFDQIFGGVGLFIGWIGAATAIVSAAMNQVD